MKQQKDFLMKAYQLFRAALSLALDICELYLPQLAFSIMFLAFLIQILSRYLLSFPVTWAYEITAMCFVWTTLLGACYAMRENSHVVFGIVYDALSKRAQRFVRLTGKLIIVITFVIAFYPTYDYVRFVEFQKSTVLRISFSVIYGPFLVFLALVIGRTVKEILSEIIGTKEVDS